MEPEPVAEPYVSLPVVNASAIFEVKNRCEPFAVTFDCELSEPVPEALYATFVESIVTVYPPDDLL
jgi:hypothetical protein